jgi:hypothetical protein
MHHREFCTDTSRALCLLVHSACCTYARTLTSPAQVVTRSVETVIYVRRDVRWRVSSQRRLCQALLLHRKPTWVLQPPTQPPITPTGHKREASLPPSTYRTSSSEFSTKPPLPSRSLPQQLPSAHRRATSLNQKTTYPRKRDSTLVANCRT